MSSITEYSQRIQVRCSKQLLREIKKAAKQLDMTASNYIRLVLQRKLTPSGGQDEQGIDGSAR